MDRFNSRTFLKSSNIDDGYWEFSLLLANQFRNAVEQDDDKEILRLLDNPRLFTGRT